MLHPPTRAPFKGTRYAVRLRRASRAFPLPYPSPRTTELYSHTALTAPRGNSPQRPQAPGSHFPGKHDGSTYAYT